MRLIDADKEVERLRKEIKEFEEKIARLDKEDDYDLLIEYLVNKINCNLKEIVRLNSYSTAYDLDILLDGLNEILKDEISQPVADCVYECVQQGYW